MDCFSYMFINPVPSAIFAIVPSINSRMNTLLRYTFLPLLISLIIFIGTCLIQPSHVPDMPPGVPWDKLVHFGMFFLLSAVALIDYYRLHKGSPSVGRWVFWGFVIPVIYGGIIEILQYYAFSQRSAEWGDWIADILGSLTASLLIILFLKKRDYSKKKISL